MKKKKIFTANNVKMYYNFILMIFVLTIVTKFALGLVQAAIKGTSILGGIFEYLEKAYYIIGLCGILLFNHAWKIFLIYLVVFLIGSFIMHKIAVREVVWMGVAEGVWVYTNFCYNNFVQTAMLNVKNDVVMATKVMAALIKEPKIVFFNLGIVFVSLDATYVLLRYIYKCIDYFCVTKESEGHEDEGEQKEDSTN